MIRKLWEAIKKRAWYTEVVFLMLATFGLSIATNIRPLELLVWVLISKVCYIESKLQIKP